MRPQLIGHRYSMSDQVLTGPTGPTQRDRRVAVPGQRHQPSPVGPQRVGQHERVPAVTPLTGWSGKVLLADFTSASSLLVPVGRHPSLVPERCRFAH
jgi:hypothetical protein